MGELKDRMIASMELSADDEARMPHPWCHDVARDEAVRRAEDAAAVPEIQHRDLPEAVAALTRRVERLEEPSVAVKITKRVKEFIDWLETDPTPADFAVRIGNGWWFPKSDQPATQRPPAPPPPPAPPQPAPVPPAESLRTERVTLEIALDEAGQRAFAMVSEMVSRFPVRVVEAPSAADIAGMEYRGNSVGYWYAKTEAYRQVVRDCRQQIAVNDGETLAQAAARLTAEREAAIRERDEARAECERWRRECRSARDHCTRLAEERDAALDDADVLRARVAELEAAAAANAGGEQEPVAWGVWVRGAPYFVTWSRADAEREMKVLGDAVSGLQPLYAAPQPPRGWLTGEERNAVNDCLRPAREEMDLLKRWRPDHRLLDELRRKEAVLTALLARSTPPRVRRPNVRLGSFPKDRDDAWIAAIREAGGEVAE